MSGREDEDLELQGAEAGEAAGNETAVAEQDAGAESAVERMDLQAEITDSGPCKKHVRVQVARTAIDQVYNEAIRDLIGTANVPGFRPGHVPRKLVEKKFRKEVGDQVKQKVLMQSLEQVAEEHKLDAINEPDLDVLNMEIPEEGDFTYEFDVEVRPEFELPNYNGLKIRRPVHTVTDADVQTYLERYLAQFGQLVPQDDPAETGDFITATVTVTHGDKELMRAADQSIRIRSSLQFEDAKIESFDTLMVGVVPGDVREVDTTVSSEAACVELRGETVHVKFEVSDVKRLRLPELTSEFLAGLSVESEEQLRDEVRNILERQATYDQRQSARRQVLEKITESATWDLPESLVRRQVENALRREILEMQQAGFTDEQIRARQSELMQRQVSMTRQALKEHFVLDKIAAQEKLDVAPMDVDLEISYMAMQRGESRRKVRARLEKQGMMDNLTAQILERKAIDIVLDRAEYEDLPAEAAVPDSVEGVPLSVCGQSSEAAPEPTAAEETPAAE